MQTESWLISEDPKTRIRVQVICEETWSGEKKKLTQKGGSTAPGRVCRQNPAHDYYSLFPKAHARAGLLDLFPIRAASEKQSPRAGF